MSDPSKASAKVFILTGEWQDFRGKNTLRFAGTSGKTGKIAFHLQSEFKNKTKILW